jgi:hypothetical protein
MDPAVQMDRFQYFRLLAQLEVVAVGTKIPEVVAVNLGDLGAEKDLGEEPIPRELELPIKDLLEDWVFLT